MNKVHKVYSLYWSNIDQEIVDFQKKVFNHLGIPLVQELKDQVPHGVWMDEVINRLNIEDIVIFCDIDAFPLSYEAYEVALKSANNNEIFGLAQVANHLQKSKIYAGPMFLAFKKKIWIDMGSPSLMPTPELDAGQQLSEYAIKNNILLNLMFPSSCIMPKWPLYNLGIFGIGTFYQDKFFHLFESRTSSAKKMFTLVALDLLNNRDLNFEDYLNCFNQKQANSILSIAVTKLKGYYRSFLNMRMF